MALSMLQFITPSTVDFSAGVFVELESKIAFLSDTLVVDQFEILRTLSQFASAFRSECVTLLADFVTGSLEVLVSSWARFSDAFVTNSLESFFLFASDKNALILF